MMSISPDKFTEVEAVTNTSGVQNDGNAVASRATPVGQNTYVTVPSTDRLTSNIVGLDIYNGDNKEIGTIKDVAIGPNGREQAYIVSVGGFLGIGDHYVAVDPSAVKVSFSDHRWRATMNATYDQLKSAPEFHYGGSFGNKPV
jgi:sporulation protein YlmC with PRC-barrel domain